MWNNIVIEPHFKIPVENSKEIGPVHHLPLDPHFADAASKNKKNKYEAEQKIFLFIQKLRNEKIIGHIDHESKISDFQQGDLCC